MAQQNDQHGHIPELQTLRGIAALVVLLHHSSFLFATSPSFRWLCEALLNAHAAVVIFFVLSGYVLTRSLAAKPASILTTVLFYVRRGFRIFPACVVAALLGAAYLLILHNRVALPHPSGWYLQRYSVVHPGWREVALNAAAIHVTLVPPMWSIRIELMASILMPLIAVVCRGPWAILTLIATAIAGLAFGTHSILVSYLFAFAVGASVYRHQAGLASIGRSRWFGLACLVLLLFFRLVNPAWRFEVNYGAVAPGLVEAAAGGGVVLFLALNSKPSTPLRLMPLQRLGDISYSLYLIHFPIMSSLALLPIFQIWSPDVSALGLMALTLAVAAPLAFLSYHYVELPGLALGKAITQSLGRINLRRATTTGEDSLPV